MTHADNTIDEAACRWAVIMESRPLNAAERHALDQWLAADIRHIGALTAARAQWLDLDRVSALAVGHARDESGAIAALDCVDSRRRWLIAAGIGSIAATGLGAWILSDHGERYRTAVGEMRRVILHDGSTLMLNTDSEARIDFQPQIRTIYLTRGEALFDVAHDAARPFVVRANDVRVRAVGTVFAVRLRDSKVNVTVSEGVVELARTSTSASAVTSAPQRVAANQQSIVESAAPAKVTRIAPEVVERRLAWLNGMVAFDGETLADAIAEVNRHSRRHIVIDDASLSQQPIVGVFRAADAEGFCRTAAAALGAVAVEEGDTIYLRRADHHSMDLSRVDVNKPSNL